VSVSSHTCRAVEKDRTAVPEKTGDEGNEGHRKRLRERFARAGFDALSDHEVLELLLTLCIPRRDVKGPAKRLLARFGSLRGVLDARPEDLDAVPGIGSVTPVALRIIRESAALYLRQVMESAPVFDGGRRLCEFLLLRMGGCAWSASTCFTSTQACAC
jgi:DNA repair protein RadC